MSNLFSEFTQLPRAFFLDMNAFYTSVEQQECPEYRGRPTIVVPVLADNTCAIAASYEAKALGIKTGTGVRLARMAVPDLRIVEARPQLYLDYHHRLVALLKDYFARVKVLSIDEMSCPVSHALYKSPVDEEKLARKVKAHIARELGPYLTCSVGVAPNVFLAKVASERTKPDGLTLWHDHNLPDALFECKLADLPGIGPAMRRRLKEQGVITVETLWQTSAHDLRKLWGSVVGERWWHMLRGSHECDYEPMQRPEEVKKSVGHSNVLAPEYRNVEGARRVLLELFSKALGRLRSYNQAASAVQITVRYRRCHRAKGDPQFTTPEGVWVRRTRKHLHANEELIWLKIVRPIVNAIPDLRPSSEPCFVAILFSELLKEEDQNLSLFEEEDNPRKRLALLVDAVNKQKAGSVRLATFGASDVVPQRIPFGAPE